MLLIYRYRPCRSFTSRPARLSPSKDLVRCHHGAVPSPLFSLSHSHSLVSSTSPATPTSFAPRRRLRPAPTLARNGSSAPGPLEANKRLARRRMGALICPAQPDLPRDFLPDLDAWPMPWSSLSWSPPRPREAPTGLDAHTDAAAGATAAPAPAAAAPTRDGPGRADSASKLVEAIAHADSFYNFSSLATLHSQNVPASTFWQLAVAELAKSDRLIDTIIDALLLPDPAQHATLFFTAYLETTEYKERYALLKKVRLEIIFLVEQQLVVVDECLLATVQSFFDRLLSPLHAFSLLSSVYKEAWVIAQNRGEQSMNEMATILLTAARPISLYKILSTKGAKMRGLLLSLYTRAWPTNMVPNKKHTKIGSWISSIDSPLPRDHSGRTYPLNHETLVHAIAQLWPIVEKFPANLTNAALTSMGLSQEGTQACNSHRPELTRWVRLLEHVTARVEEVEPREWVYFWDKTYLVLAFHSDMPDLLEHFLPQPDEYICRVLTIHWSKRFYYRDPTYFAWKRVWVIYKAFKKALSVLDGPVPFAPYVAAIESFAKFNDGRYRRVLREGLEMCLHKNGVKGMVMLEEVLRHRNIEVYSSCVARALWNANITGHFPFDESCQFGSSQNVWFGYIRHVLDRGAAPSRLFKLLPYSLPQFDSEDDVALQPSRLSPRHVELVHFLAWQFASSQQLPPASRFRQVYACYRYLTDRRAKVYPLLTRAFVRAAIIEPLRLSSIRLDSYKLAQSGLWAAAAHMICPLLGTLTKRKSNPTIDLLRRWQLKRMERPIDLTASPAGSGDVSQDDGRLLAGVVSTGHVAETDSAGRIHDLNCVLPPQRVSRRKLTFVLDLVERVEGRVARDQISRLIRDWESIRGGGRAATAASRTQTLPHESLPRAHHGLSLAGGTAAVRRSFGAEEEAVAEPMVRRVVSVAVPRLVHGVVMPGQYRWWRTAALAPISEVDSNQPSPTDVTAEPEESWLLDGEGEGEGATKDEE